MELRLTISGSQRCTYQQHLKAHSNLKHILNEEIKISDKRMIMQKTAATNEATHETTPPQKWPRTQQM